MQNFFNWLEISKLVWVALFRKKHFYIAIAVLDDFQIYQQARHISVEAVVPVLNHTMQNAVENGLMGVRPCEHEQVLLDAREKLYEEKRKRGEL